ncbi:MAG: GNAT family N-acetyltransferase, partial [Acidimicrobiales bacterium]
MDALRTHRLLLRRWREADLETFAAMNADPEVMEHFPAPLDRAASDGLVGRIEAGFVERGFGLWALEVAATGRLIGFTGLSVPRFAAPFMPAVEVGWRLARAAWGRGYATEAGIAALEAAFG